MTYVTSTDDLEAVYGSPGEASLIKVTDFLTPTYSAWIERARFCVLSTVGPEGTDGSPRGDTSPVVVQQNPQTLLMPDWRGNNRMDSLRNIVRDGRVSLMFMVAGSSAALRVNGHAKLSIDPKVLSKFEDKGALPRSVIEIKISEVYSQCARAILRAGLWTDGDQSIGLPTVGDMLKDVKRGFNGAKYDAEWGARAAKTMW